MEDNALSVLINFDRFFWIDRFNRISYCVDSRDQNQSFCLAAAHSGFLSNLTKHIALPSLASIQDLQSFVVPHLTSTTIFFEHYYRMYPFHRQMLSIFSWLNFVSFQQRFK